MEIEVARAHRANQHYLFLATSDLYFTYCYQLRCIQATFTRGQLSVLFGGTVPEPALIRLMAGSEGPWRPGREFPLSSAIPLVARLSRYRPREITRKDEQEPWVIENLEFKTLTDRWFPEGKVGVWTARSIRTLLSMVKDDGMTAEEAVRYFQRWVGD